MQFAYKVAKVKLPVCVSVGSEAVSGRRKMISDDDDDVIDDAVLQGFQEGISFGLGMIPEVGPFLQVIFGHIWDIALAKRTAAEKQKEMDALFATVSKMIDKALDKNVADQARAYNASIAQLGQDYRVSAQAFKETQTETEAQKVVVRFESCKSTLILMLNLFAQESYMKQTVLSYGSALALYAGLLWEMSLAGKDCGYSESEISEFVKDINSHVESAYQQTMYDAVSKLVTESGEFLYPKMGGLVMNLGKLVGGLMNLNSDWHDGKPCLIAQPHPDYECDLVDNKAYYQLGYRPKEIGALNNHYSMPQVFMNNRAALHVYTQANLELQVACFAVQETMDVNFRAYYLIDNQDFVSTSDVEVNISTYNNPRVYQFNLTNLRRTILSLPWVRMYYSNDEGGPWTTHFDKFSTDFRMQYNEYKGFQVVQDKVYTITTKAGSNATQNYYFIGFEVVPA